MCSTRTPSTTDHTPVAQVWDDLHTERSGYYRAFLCVDEHATTGCPVVGYCSPGGSHRTIKAVAAEARRLYPWLRVYRNEKEVAR